MRSQQLGLTLNPQKYVSANDETKIFQCMNLSVANKIFVQFGEAPGHSNDAWPIRPGDVYTLDPAAPKQTIWLWSDLAGIDNRVIIG